jgi:hypothetical protein
LSGGATAQIVEASPIERDRQAQAAEVLLSSILAVSARRHPMQSWNGCWNRGWGGADTRKLCRSRID